jgi:hypothetical protein
MSNRNNRKCAGTALVTYQEIKKAAVEQRQLIQQLLDKIESLEKSPGLKKSFIG